MSEIPHFFRGFVPITIGISIGFISYNILLLAVPGIFLEILSWPEDFLLKHGLALLGDAKSTVKGLWIVIVSYLIENYIYRNFPEIKNWLKKDKTKK